jgi:2-C-methyl-D-erythritol 4-phosphate cytidylyltransferase
VVAGGSGRRFGGPKQFLELAGRPVSAWSVDGARSVADGVVLVVPVAGSGLREGAAGDPAMGADRVVEGGATRAESVRAGLAVVPEDAEIIVVHDAVRPLASPALFAAVVDAVRSGECDGAVPVLPVADTLKRSSGGRVLATVDRHGLVTTQTPQAFVASTLRLAHGTDADTTDDAGLLERLGATVATVAGDTRNLKLTRPEDLQLAEALMESTTR